MLLLFIKKHFKAVLMLLALVGMFAAGYQSHRPATVTVTKTVVQWQTKTVEAAKSKDKSDTTIVTVKKPDGTVTTTEHIEDTKVATDNKTSTASGTTTTEQTMVKAAGASAAAKYSLGVEWYPKLDAKAYMPSYADFGYRALGPVWVTAGWDWEYHHATVGLRLEW